MNKEIKIRVVLDPPLCWLKHKMWLEKMCEKCKVWEKSNKKIT